MTQILHAFAQTFAPMLRTLSTLIDKGAAHASAEGRDPDALAEARLAPDMLPLKAQVRLACDLAAAGVARLVGEEPPSSTDGGDPASLDQLKARIAAALAYLDAVPAARFEGAEDKDVAFTLMNGALSARFTGVQFLRDWSLPNFYFHVVTAYDILRREGAAIGKADYMGHAAYAIRPAG